MRWACVCFILVFDLFLHTSELGLIKATVDTDESVPRRVARASECLAKQRHDSYMYLVDLTRNVSSIDRLMDIFKHSLRFTSYSSRLTKCCGEHVTD